MGEVSGMGKNRFDDITRFYTVSVAKTAQLEDPAEANQWRWCLVDDFVVAFNKYNVKVFVRVSEDLCVDESFRRWYGFGGTWIQIGLPFYVSIDRKPGNDCEIWTMCDGRWQFMLSMEIVKDNTAVTLRLVKGYNRRFRKMAMYGDSFFASVATADALWAEFGEYFTGVVKQCSSRFPKASLNAVELEGPGNSRSMVRKSS